MKRVILAISLVALMGVIFAACGGGGGGGGGSTTPPGTVPTVLSVFPVDGSDQVSTNTDISITFSEAMDKTSVQSNTSITSVAGTFSTVSYSWEALDTKMVISPTAAMADSTKYVVSIASQTLDAEGDSMAAAYMFSFTTGSVPTGLFTHPNDGDTNVAVATTVGAQFSEPMDTQSVEDSFGFMGAGYAGTLTYTWTNVDQDLEVSFSPQLSSGVTYTATLLPGAEDIQGTPMELYSKISFATGSTLATGSISGVISDDPDSSFDDSLGETFVALFDHNFMDTQGPQPTLTQSDASGAYHFSYLSPGLYYALGLQETNGDGELGGDELTSGDSMGWFSDITQLSAAFDSISVAAIAVTGIDFTLLDTEAIIGDISYAGLNTTLAYSSNAYIGAFTSTDISAMSGTPPYSAVAWNTDNFDPGTNLWDYSINSYFSSPFGTRLPTGTHYVGAFIDFFDDGYDPDIDFDGDYEDGEPAGMFINAVNSVSILETGHDAIGVDITTYDAITLHGPIQQVDLASPIGTGSPFVSTPYPGGEVSLLSYPLKAAGDSTGDFTMQFVPLGPTLAIHGKPAAGSTLIPYNSKYAVFTTADAWRPVSDPGEVTEVNLISPSVAAWLGSLCSVTVDTGKALIAGQINDSVTGNSVLGAEVLFAGPAVKYIDTGMNCNNTTTQDMGGGGPQFLIFNVDSTLYADNKALISASQSSTIIDSAYIPVVNGEFTLVDMEK